MDINKYAKNIINEYNTGSAREHAYRSYLKSLLEEENNVKAINEPSGISWGNPDFQVRYNNLPFGYIECKDLNKPLDYDFLNDSDKEQRDRYLYNTNTLLCTDYNRFILYKNNKVIFDTKIIDNDLKPIKKNFKDLESLLNYFINSAPIPINSADKLAYRLAENAKIITDTIINELDTNGEDSQLFDIYKTFTDKLINNLKYKDFAQMMAQTVCYGLFAAKYNKEKPHAYDPNRPQEFTRENAYLFLPNTNKSLKEIFRNISSDDFFEGIKWVAEDVVRILNYTDMSCVLNHFGESGDSDPIIHFYETFLNKYDPEYKKSLGVFYTPKPVVDYIVKSIDYVLKSEFGEELGLASERKDNGEYLVQILDPATGTGAFLTDIISNIHKTVISKLGSGAWNEYVKDNLLERLNAFEIMMAPYTIAHINVAQQLSELGYDLTNDKPLNIVLADTLQEVKEDQDQFDFMPGLTKEIKNANAIKSKKKIMVICGNPPYNSKSKNNDKYIMDLIRNEYYPNDEIEERHKKTLSDDFIKFIRFAQNKLNNAEKGILGFITNNCYIDSPTFRKIRQSLMTTFNKIYILNLQGNSYKKLNEKDENVFDIKSVGTSIIIGVKNKNPYESFVKYKDLYGLRKEKYAYLRDNSIETTDFEIVEPQTPFFMFSPRNNNLENEYKKFYSIRNIFNLDGSGLKTRRDNIAITFEKEKIKNIITDFSKLSLIEFKQKYKINKEGNFSTLEHAKEKITNNLDYKNIKEIYYRPFDIRFIYYTDIKGYIAEPRFEIMHHLLKDNLSFLISREALSNNNSNQNIILITNKISEMKTNSSIRGTQVFPFYLYNKSEGLIEYDEKVPNLDINFVNEIEEQTGLKYVPQCDENKLNELKENEFAPRHVFNYIYGLLSGKAYREKYMTFIDTDFPRVPLPKNKDLFLKIGEFGATLIDLHLMKKSYYDNPFEGVGDGIVDKRKYENNKIYINKDQYFDNVSEDVWNFNMGGYQVLDKYLKDRKGRKLTTEEISHYQNIIGILKETLKLTNDYNNYILDEIED